MPVEIRGELRKVFGDWIQGKVKTPQNYENKVITKHGEIRLIRWYNTELRNNSDQLEGTLSSGEDITERKQAEMELRRTFEVLEKGAEGIDAGLAVIGKDYRVIWANKRLMDLGVLPNKKCHQTFNRSEMVCVDCGAKKIFQQDIALDVHEFEKENTKGETTWIELRVTPLKDKNGKIEVPKIAVPITERKKAEQELKEKELKYYNIFNTSAVGMFRTRLDGSEIVDFNDKYLEIFGLVREEMQGLRSVMFWRIRLNAIEWFVYYRLMVM